MYEREVEKTMNMKNKGAGPEGFFEEDLFAALNGLVFGSSCFKKSIAPARKKC